MSQQEVVVSFLERDLVELPVLAALPFTLERIAPAEAAVASAAMYRAVGGPWHWTDRRNWTAAEWAASVAGDDVEVWVAKVDGEVAGYFELHPDGDAVELKYFGLVPAWTGRRLGAPLLETAIARAATSGKPRMTLNTCSLDHPSALPNYRKRGFRVVRTKTEWRELDP
jgi:GNAT superfamily N-acetyltransferase